VKDDPRCWLCGNLKSEHLHVGAYVSPNFCPGDFTPRPTITLQEIKEAYDKALSSIPYTLPEDEE